jgi:hypothetical protein
VAYVENWLVLGTICSFGDGRRDVAGFGTDKGWRDDDLCSC